MGLLDTTVEDTITKAGAPTDQVTQSKSFSYDPTLGTVNTGTDTVSGQLDKILSQDSPLMQSAGQRGAQLAQSKGLLNSSMGVEAGQKAVIDTALPIAQQDAATFSQQRTTNQQAGNAASQFGAASANTAAISNAGASNDRSLQTLKGTQAQGLADTEANYKTLLQTSASAAQTFAQASKNINDIMNDATTSPEFKQSGIAKANETLRNTLSVLGSIANLNLSSLLTFT